MYRLPSIIGFLSLSVSLFSQSPHGADFKVNCAACHTADGWDIPIEKWKFNESDDVKKSEMTGWVDGQDTMRFKHGKTDFPLTGQHTRVNCRTCHQSMVFSEASPQCISCHTDIHQMTAGNNCARCHTTENWLVDKVSELHQDNGFPLLGSHALAACVDCHTSESGLRFDRIGNDCNNCHQSDYAATTQPNHGAAGFSTTCSDCHDLSRFDWNTNKVKHDFFPLTKGHDIADCATCHTTGNYANTPSYCISCHTTAYQTATNPNHVLAGFSQNCVDCHTTDKDWMPAKYTQHDVEYFPIYSGEHQGEWNQCADCHTNPSNFAEFTCITCHTNPETNNEHNGISGYSYNSPACLACHPNGSEDDAFDHNNTQFPLKGAHATTACVACHANGYAGTPTNCAACHTPDYNQTTNPNHLTAQFSTDCKSCHSETAWTPATFNHNSIYPLNGAHATTACNACHINGNYSNTPTTCVGCHQSDFNQTTNPNHTSAQFPTDCKACHSETAWEPANFNHDAMYFPIYSGKHKNEWNQCTDCHTTPGNYALFSCTVCHTSQSTNNDHQDVSGYVYSSTACFTCHPNGD